MLTVEEIGLVGLQVCKKDNRFGKKCEYIYFCITVIQPQRDLGNVSHAPF